MIPGEIRTGAGELKINDTRTQLHVTVVNDGDRPIQIGSHLHFPDANPALSFDRSLTEGFRLDIPSGTSLRFEPGVGAEVTLVELGGRRKVPGIVVPGTRAARTGDPEAARTDGTRAARTDGM
ncbi:urease subunit beta [Streptomyces sp. NBC_00378]|uniref:urease subunit beta n=1 Tax=unclassified Streptomyces TaxID=2593676 RepID=UPI0022596E06|nr:MULTISPECIES: urease subunit beta [unclassified Streptomyces]MCX5108495.1 urease subunit beta [Streptomyces sp. NBC_00378]